jgi:hypothetical protein
VRLGAGGHAYCWGGGVLAPALVPGPWTFSQVSTYALTCGVTTTARLVCWGGPLPAPAEAAASVGFASVQSWFFQIAATGTDGAPYIVGADSTETVKVRRIPNGG